jgi:predicted cobalt transporter CbtA
MNVGITWIGIGFAALGMTGTGPTPEEPSVPAAIITAREVWPNACLPTIQPARLPRWTLATADASTCTIRLSDRATHWTQAYLCAVIVHETGHLAGQGHSPDQASPMYRLSHPIPQCPGRYSDGTKTVIGRTGMQR